MGGIAHVTDITPILYLHDTSAFYAPFNAYIISHRERDDGDAKEGIYDGDADNDGIDGGDHRLYVGKICRFAADPLLAPLVFHGGNYRALRND